jgi:hypothetical protein
MGKGVTFDDVLALAKQLGAKDKVRLIERLAPDIERELVAVNSRPRKSLWGLCADLGKAPSSQEIDKARREEWANSPYPGRDRLLE